MRLYMLVWLGAVLLMVVTPACRRDDASPAPTATSPGIAAEAESPTPEQVVNTIHELRKAGHLVEMQGHFVIAQRQAVLELVQSIDTLLAANAALLQAVREKYGVGSPGSVAFDRSGYADRLGLLSMHLKVIDASRANDRAVVTIQVADQLPLEEVELVRVGGHWLVQTDPPIPGLPEEIRRFAEAMAGLSRRVTDDRITMEELRAALLARQEATARRMERRAAASAKP